MSMWLYMHAHVCMVPNWVPQELDGLQLHMTKFVAFEDFISYPHQDAKQAHYGSHLFTKLIVFFVLKLVRTLFDHDEIWVCLNIGDPKKPMVCHHSTHVLFWVYQSVSPIDTTICWDWHSPTWLDLHFDEELPSNCVVLEISCSLNWFENVQGKATRKLYIWEQQSYFPGFL